METTRSTSAALKMLVGILLIALIQGASAQSGVNQTEQANVSVTVSAVTMVDIAPATFTYIASPGQACGKDISNGLCNETANNYFAIQVENIGSWNVTKIWFNVSQESQSPFGVGSDAYVNPGNFVALSTNETTNDFYFVDRKEFKELRNVVFLRDPDGNMPANLTKFNYGRMHNGTNEYFYMIENSTYGGCNVSGISYIRVGVNARSLVQIGSTDFSTGPSVNYIQINLTTRSQAGYPAYAMGNISTGALSGYAIAVENTTCVVRFSKWNKDFPFDVGASNYSFSGMLTPGDSLAKKIGIIVPYGIYASTKTGQLTAIAMGAA